MREAGLYNPLPGALLSAQVCTEPRVWHLLTEEASSGISPSRSGMHASPLLERQRSCGPTLPFTAAARESFSSSCSSTRTCRGGRLRPITLTLTLTPALAWSWVFSMGLLSGNLAS